MGCISYRNFSSVLVFIALLVSGPTFAQSTEDADQEYDDLEAAGEFDYGDSGSEPPTTAGDVAVESDNRIATGVLAADDGGGDAPELPWLWGGKRRHPNMFGTIGLLRIIEADSASKGNIGFGLHLSGFKYSDYLIPGDEHSSMWSNLHINYTPLDFLEVYFGIENMAAHNTMERPELFQTLGDLRFGAKGYYTFLDWITVGGSVEVNLLNSVGDIGFEGAATGVGLNALTSFDFGKLKGNNNKVPIRAHLNVGYAFDNSAKLVTDYEEEGGGCGDDPDDDGRVSYTGCLSPVERTALSINRVDAIKIGIGIDAALKYVSPIIEWGIELPVNRGRRFTCPDGGILDTPNGPMENPDSCLQQEGASSFRQRLTFGARVLPPLDSLSIDIGVDIGLTGYAPSVHELAAEAPWRILGGLSYSFDPSKRVVTPKEVVKLVPQAVAEIKPRIFGLVMDAANPVKTIPGAVVEYLGLDFNRQVTDKAGRFKSYELTPGLRVTFVVSAEGYKDGTFSAEIPTERPAASPKETLPVDSIGDKPNFSPSAEGELAVLDENNYLINMDCPLEAVPQGTSLTLEIVNDEDIPLANIPVKIIGEQEWVATTNSLGRIEKDVAPGKYVIVIEQEGYLRRQANVETEVGVKSEIRLQLRTRPKKASARVKKDRIVFKGKILFKISSDVIDTRSYPVLEEVADILLSNQQVKLVEVQGHTDNSGSTRYNKELSQKRADSVRNHLVNLGVKSARITAKGYGPSRPIAPNITRSSRARNRRVEFHIIDRD